MEVHGLKSNFQPESELSIENRLPQYLERIFGVLPTATRQEILARASRLRRVQVESEAGCRQKPRDALFPILSEVKDLPSREEQYASLLLLRHQLTMLLADFGSGSESSTPTLSPRLILERAAVYEALAYHELALADAYVAYTLCEVVLEGVEVSDLVPDEGFAAAADEDKGHPHNQDSSVRRFKYECLVVLCRCATALGCGQQANLWYEEALNTQRSLCPAGRSEGAIEEAVECRLNDGFVIFTPVDHGASQNRSPSSLFGWSQRQIYPWNEHEPERMSSEAVQEINSSLKNVSRDLEVKRSLLPALNGTHATDVHGNVVSPPPTALGASSCQLGLYAMRDLPPGATILEERSVLTGIRPHGEALCDACAADVENIPQDLRRYCPGCGIPFCSEDCYRAAKEKYHTPNDDNNEDSSDDDDDDYPPYEAPFCPGSSGNDDIQTLGRAESSTTAEWDLYFLLLARTLQMAETQGKHPLDLFETKYLWGDFAATPVPENVPSHSGPHTLPYSLRHHVELPLQWFEILMHSRPECRPYSAHWLKNYDWWMVQTLFAKFRGVADAQQSTWTGTPEIAAVHPLWCLANHSCNPNVTWKPSGVRNLTVVSTRAWTRPDIPKHVEWHGIMAGEQIWNHYTDVNEKDYRERRARLREVLGGDCMCERCVYEEKMADEPL